MIKKIVLMNSILILLAIAALLNFISGNFIIGIILIISIFAGAFIQNNILNKK